MRNLVFVVLAACGGGSDNSGTDGGGIPGADQGGACAITNAQDGTSCIQYEFFPGSFIDTAKTNCSHLGGTFTAKCPTTMLFGCCRGGGDIEVMINCLYTDGSESSNEVAMSACAPGGTWTSTVPQ